MHSRINPNEKNSHNRLSSLYKHGKENEDKIQIQKDEKEKIKKEKELEGCTFKHKINSNYTPIKKNILNSRNEMTLYERQQLWNNKKIEKIEKEKNLKQIQENCECTFTPIITKNTLIETSANKQLDKQTKNFYERITKAKLLKEEINSKLNPDYSKQM